MATPETEVHALRTLVGHLLWMAAKTDRPHLEEMLEQVNTTAALSPAVMSPGARNVLPQSCRIQREMIEAALSRDPKDAG